MSRAAKSGDEKPDMVDVIARAINRARDLKNEAAAIAAHEFKELERKAEQSKLAALIASRPTVYELDGRDMLASASEERRLRACAEMVRLYTAEGGWNDSQAAFLFVDGRREEPTEKTHRLSERRARPTRSDGRAYETWRAWWCDGGLKWIAEQLGEDVAHWYRGEVRSRRRVVLVTDDGIELVYQNAEARWVSVDWRAEVARQQEHHQRRARAIAEQQAKADRRRVAQQFVESNPEILFDLAVRMGLADAQGKPIAQPTPAEPTPKRSADFEQRLAAKLAEIRAKSEQEGGQS